MSGLFLATPHILPSSAWSTTLKTPLSSSSHRITLGLCAGLLSTLSSQCVILAFPTLDLLEIFGVEDKDEVDVEDDDDLALLAVLTFESLLQNKSYSPLKPNSIKQEFSLKNALIAEIMKSP